MSIAVIGAGGQLGQDLCEQSGPTSIALIRRDIELTNRESVSRVLRSLSPRVVVNAAAFNLVDAAEDRPTEAFEVNAFGVRELSLVCRDIGCVLVHFSTDYVFGLDEELHEPYNESAAPGPVSVYGSSKLAGEYFVRSICRQHFVLRSSGLYGLRGSGGKGRNFVETMLRVGKERGEVRVVNDQICTPTSSADLAAATLQLLATRAFGLYHWTNSGCCTWYQFACEIFRQSGLQVKCTPITSAEYAARAKRPRYSVLSTEKYQRIGLAAPRSWQGALHDYLERRSRGDE